MRRGLLVDMRLSGNVVEYFFYDLQSHEIFKHYDHDYAPYILVKNMNMSQLDTLERYMSNPRIIKVEKFNLLTNEFETCSKIYYTGLRNMTEFKEIFKNEILENHYIKGHIGWIYDKQIKINLNF
jgi:hypothetical protein